MLILPNDHKNKIGFESKAILLAFSIAIVAILTKGYANTDLISKLDSESDPSAKKALQQMNLQFVKKESQKEKERAEKTKVAARSIAGIYLQNQKSARQE